jgi:hypothetical protein
MKKLLAIIVLGLMLSGNAYGNSEDLDNLKKLAEAYKSGLITKEIFESSKKRILKNFNNQTTKKKSSEKKYELKGERSIALSWEGYDDLIAGKVIFDEKNYDGTLILPLPNNDGTCNGTYSLQKGGKGVWQITCTNNMGAEGTLKWASNGGVTGIGKDNSNKKVKFTVSKNS